MLLFVRNRHGADIEKYRLLVSFRHKGDISIKQFHSYLALPYEQRKTVLVGTVDLGEYMKRWVRWTTVGLSGLQFYGVKHQFRLNRLQTAQSPGVLGLASCPSLKTSRKNYLY